MKSPYKRVGKQKILNEVFNTKMSLVNNAKFDVEDELTYLFNELEDMFSHSKEKAVNIGTAIIQAFLLGRNYESRNNKEVR